MKLVNQIILISVLLSQSILWAQTEVIKPTEVVKTELPESQIPLKAAIVKKEAVQSTSVFGVLIGVAIVGIMGAAGIIFLKKYSFKNRKNPHTEIKVLTQHHLGPKKSLAIIRVAGESILIGVTDQNINLIKSLSLLDEDIPEETPTNFNKVINAKMANTPKEVDPLDDFNFNGIKDRVTSKLKNMRSLE